MKTMTIMIAVFLLTGTIGVRAQAPGDTTMRIGLGIGAAYSMHSASFVDLPGMTSCCPEFTSGTGFGPTAALQVTFPLSTKLRLNVRAGYASLPGSFTEEEFIGYALDGTGDNARVVRGTSEHNLETSMAAIELIPRIEFAPVDNMGLGLHALVDVGFLMSGTYEAKETLTNPTGGVFSDSRASERNVTSGDITNLSSPMISIGAGVHWDLPLSESWWLTPEVSWYQGLTSVADFTSEGRGDSWSASSIRAGIVLAYAFIPSPEVPTTPGMRVSVDAKAMDDDDRLSEVAEVRIEETLSTQIYPLLPYVFFDDGVSTINTNTYRNLTPAMAEDFTDQDPFTFDNTLATSRSAITLDVYYNLLNVVGYRMSKKYPDATLTLTGCNSDQGADRGDAGLSQQRAEQVRDYLTNVWGIDASRITVTSRGLPERASKYTVRDERDKQDAIEENRRVELASNRPEVLFPVVINDTLREITPPKLHFGLNVRSPQPLSMWRLTAIHPFTPTAVQTGAMMLEEEGSGTPPPSVVWEQSGSQREVPKNDDPIIATLSVEDQEGERAAASDTLTVDYYTIERKKREKVGNYQIDKFRLSLFEYEEADLNALHQRIVDEFIKPSLTPNAIIEIHGYTDRKGAESLNQRLSEQRAQTVFAALGSPQGATVTAHGEGSREDVAPFTNGTPEGRLYNRTVDVIVKIPAQ